MAKWVDDVDWSSRSTIEGRNAIVERFYPWAEQAVYLAMKHLPSHVDQDVLLSYASEALIESVVTFDSTKGMSFRSYAVGLMRFKIVDGLRDEDFISRNARKLVVRRTAAESSLMRELHRKPTPEEVMETAGFSPMEYFRSLGGVERKLSEIVTGMRSEHETTLETDLGEQCVKDLDRADAFERIMRGFSMLDKVIVYLYVWRGTKMALVGEAVGFSESRVSERFSQIVALLKQFDRTQELREEIGEHDRRRKSQRAANNR